VSGSIVGSTTALRFTPTERVLHWAFALLYLGLLGTGLPLLVPALRPWIRGYTPLIGVRLHLACAALWVLAVLLVVAAGDRRVLRRTGRELTTFVADDARWLRRFPRWLIADPLERAAMDVAVGRFNAGQKVNALFSALTAALLLISGLALIPLDGGVLAEWLTGADSIGTWRRAHQWLTWLVLLPVAGHVFLATLFPPTRPSLPGMLGGRVDQVWAARHHPRWRR
jgi:formate dehydrogenase subunit gamma